MPPRSWFPPLSFAAESVDAHLLDDWLRYTSEPKREGKVRIREKRSDDEIAVPIEYVMFSRIRNLFTKWSKSEG
jgi:hypothetical protein